MLLISQLLVSAPYTAVKKKKKFGKMVPILQKGEEKKSLQRSHQASQYDQNRQVTPPAGPQRGRKQTKAHMADRHVGRVQRQELGNGGTGLI